MKDLEVRTTLTDGQYLAVAAAVEAMGLTQSGFIRYVIIHFLTEQDDRLSRMREITSTPKIHTKHVENS